MAEQGKPVGPSVEVTPADADAQFLKRLVVAIRNEFIYYSFNIAAITVYMATTVYLMTGRDMFGIAALAGPAFAGSAFAENVYKQYNAYGILELVALFAAVLAVPFTRGGSPLGERFPQLTWARLFLLGASVVIFFIGVGMLFVGGMIWPNPLAK